MTSNAPKRRGRKRIHPRPEDRVSLQTRIPRHVRDRLSSYVYAFNRDNPGAGMSMGRLVGALVTRFLDERGLLNEEAY
jgi:hypothetical protein